MTINNLPQLPDSELEEIHELLIAIKQKKTHIKTVVNALFQSLDAGNAKIPKNGNKGFRLNSEGLLFTSGLELDFEDIDAFYQSLQIGIYIIHKLYGHKIFFHFHKLGLYECNIKFPLSIDRFFSSNDFECEHFNNNDAENDDTTENDDDHNSEVDNDDYQLNKQINYLINLKIPIISLDIEIFLHLFEGFEGLFYFNSSDKLKIYNYDVLIKWLGGEWTDGLDSYNLLVPLMSMTTDKKINKLKPVFIQIIRQMLNILKTKLEL